MRDANLINQIIKNFFDIQDVTIGESEFLTIQSLKEKQIDEQEQ